METKPVEQLTYEEAFKELEEIVTALENDDRALDQAIALFERGQALAHYCGGLLDEAELKIQQLTGDNLVDFKFQE